MQTQLPEILKQTAAGQEADRILRSCVHCGFCTATCPTYQLLGDELDSPRGRIYLIKQMLEGQAISTRTQLHLDRCLTCRSCETTCPSGVQYGRLVDIGRHYLEQQVGRGTVEKTVRAMLRLIVPYPRRFGVLLKLGQLFRPFMPGALQKQIPAPQPKSARPEGKHKRKMLILEGCAQSVATPATNNATARILDRLGISLISPGEAGCCGAVSLHLSAEEEALTFMRRNIDIWWPHIEAGAEALIITASGCSSIVREYGYHLRHDMHYADKAARVSELAKDISEVLAAEDFAALRIQPAGTRVAFHSPCSLQHGQQINGVVENILQQAGYQLASVPDGHLCCGSAGTYSILQPKLSKQLLANKVQALQSDQPEIIATANIGCQLHLATGADVPVRHWIELVADRLSAA